MREFKPQKSRFPAFLVQSLLLSACLCSCAAARDRGDLRHGDSGGENTETLDVTWADEWGNLKAESTALGSKPYFLYNGYIDFATKGYASADSQTIELLEGEATEQRDYSDRNHADDGGDAGAG